MDSWAPAGVGGGGGQRVEMGRGQGARGRSQACWEGSGPQKARAWASTPARGPKDKRGHDPAGQGLSPAGLGGSVRTTATVSSRRPRSPALGPMVVAGPRLLPELSETRPPPSPTAREGGTWLWPVVRGRPGPASNAQFCPTASEKPQEVRKQGEGNRARGKAGGSRGRLPGTNPALWGPETAAAAHPLCLSSPGSTVPTAASRAVSERGLASTLPGPPSAAPHRPRGL